MKNSTKVLVAIAVGTALLVILFSGRPAPEQPSPTPQEKVGYGAENPPTQASAALDSTVLNQMVEDDMARGMTRNQAIDDVLKRENISK